MLENGPPHRRLIFLNSQICEVLQDADYSQFKLGPCVYHLGKLYNELSEKELLFIVGCCPKTHLHPIAAQPVYLGNLYLFCCILDRNSFAQAIFLMAFSATLIFCFVLACSFFLTHTVTLTKRNSYVEIATT